LGDEAEVGNRYWSIRKEKAKTVKITGQALLVQTKNRGGSGGETRRWGGAEEASDTPLQNMGKAQKFWEKNSDWEEGLRGPGT